MTEKVKKRRDMIINVAFVAMIFGLIFFFVKYLFGVTAPFLLSFFFAEQQFLQTRNFTSHSLTKAHQISSCLRIR